MNREVYLEAKERHPGMLLMFRDGDRYELFDDDAETGANVLGLPWVNRPDGAQVAWFVHDSLETHLRKLLQAGHRVAICDQIEPSLLPEKAEVNRIVTPGRDAQALTDDSRLDGRPKTLTYVSKSGAWKETPWMFEGGGQ